MTVFLIVVAIMFMIAFALILPPLFRKNFRVENQSIENEANLSIGRERLRDLKNDLKAGRINQQQYDLARSELEQNLAQVMSGKQEKVKSQKNGPWLAILLLITLPLLAMGIYLKTGMLQALDPRFHKALAEQPQQMEVDLETVVDSLADRLKEEPDGEGWAMLGRSYIALGRFKEAEKAFKNAQEILGDDVSLLADYADAIGRGHNNDLTGDAKPLIKRALKLDPDHPKTRWLAGMLAYQDQEFEKVPGFLQPLLDQTEPGTEIHEGLKGLINEALSQSGKPSTEEKKQQEVSLKVNVSLSDDLKDLADPEDTVFIFAKAAQGPPMPLAVARLKVKDLPTIVTLDDNMAMRPDLKISGQKHVNISARVSKSGNAIAESGDFQGVATDIKTVRSEPVNILIDQQIP